MSFLNSQFPLPDELLHSIPLCKTSKNIPAAAGPDRCGWLRALPVPEGPQKNPRTPKNHSLKTTIQEDNARSLLALTF